MVGRVLNPPLSHRVLSSFAMLRDTATKPSGGTERTRGIRRSAAAARSGQTTPIGQLAAIRPIEPGRHTSADSIRPSEPDAIRLEQHELAERTRQSLGAPIFVERDRYLASPAARA